MKTGNMTASEFGATEKSDGEEGSGDEIDGESGKTGDNDNNMIIVGLGTIFQEMENELKFKGKSRLEAMEKKYQEEEEEDLSSADGHYK